MKRILLQRTGQTRQSNFLHSRCFSTTPTRGEGFLTGDGSDPPVAKRYPPELGSHPGPPRLTRGVFSCVGGSRVICHQEARPSC